MSTVKFECISPILAVKDIKASLRYYEGVLGFRRAAWVREDSLFAHIARDGPGVYLCQGGQGQPGTWVWAGVDDVEALHDELKTAGAHILHGPANYPWALEIRVADPDGHVIRFGSDPKTDRPFVDFIET